MIAMKFQWYVPVTSSLHSRLAFRMGTRASLEFKSTGSMAQTAGIITINMSGVT